MNLFRALIENPVLRYYRNLRSIRRLERRSRQTSIDLSASVVESTLGDYVKIGAHCVVYHANIGSFSYVARDSRLNHIDIGRFCSVGPHVKSGFGRHPTDRVSTHPVFYSNAGQCGLVLAGKSSFDEQPRTTVGNDVWIGAAAMLLDGIVVGDGAIIAAGAVVTRDVPPYAIVAGIPARVIRSRATPEQARRMAQIAWWDWPEERLREALPRFGGSIQAFLDGEKAREFAMPPGRQEQGMSGKVASA